MQLLREDDVRPEPGERVFRHGVLGPLFLWCFLVAPFVAAVALNQEVARVANELPGLAWVVLGPVLGVGGLLYFICLHASGQVVSRALLSTNWLMRVSAAGLVLKLRSYQNAHFATDVPTVVRFSWSELAAARKVTEHLEPTYPREGTIRRSWLELELRSGDATPLARALSQERDRPAPAGTVLGVTGRTRFGHVPVFVAGPGAVRVEWLGQDMLDALESHVSIQPARAFDLAAQPGTTAGATPPALDARLRELSVRGERIEAIALARRELGLSLADARAHVERVERVAA